MAQTAHTGSFGPMLSSWAGLEGSLTRVKEDFAYWTKIKSVSKSGFFSSFFLESDHFRGIQAFL